MVAVLVVGTVTAVVVLTSGGGGADGVRTIAPKVSYIGVGEPAPDFQLPTLTGGRVRLADYRGRPVVLNFWASWCTPCRREFPLLRQAYAGGKAGFALIGVDTDDPNEPDGRGFATDQHATWPSGFDPDTLVARGYGVKPLPQTLFIDRAGIVRARVNGQLDTETLRAQLAKIGVRLR